MPPPLAEFGADEARSFADQTTGVRSRRARWRSGSRRSSAGYIETGIVGKIHLDIIIITTMFPHYIIRIYKNILWER